MARITDKEINIRIISVIFAVVLWLYVASEQNPMEYKNIKEVSVQLINLESVAKSGLVIKDEQVYKVDVTLQGKRSILSEVKATDIRVEADLRGFNQKGVNSIPVEVKGVPTNVELVDFTPKNIKVSLEPIISVQVPVGVNTTGRPKDGYTSLQPVVTPGEVLVKGPESLVGNIKVQTAALKLDGTSGDVKEVLPVKVVDQDGNEITGVEISPNIVEVDVPVRRTKEVKVDVVIQGEPAQGYEIVNILQGRQTVVAYGDQNLIDSIDRIVTKPVNIAGIEQDSSYQADLIIPEGVSLIGNISRIDVNVRIEKIIAKKLIIERITPVNMGKGLRIGDNTELPRVQMTLEGRESIINRLTANDINIYVDLKDLGRGSHNVPLQADLPDGVSKKALEPDKVEIELVPANGSE
ncbi:MAG: hypothetical protein HPY66_2782 [Firmicutes bacterium]|nr:hypothetical protein [Bacillota bacterium]MDI6706353.1 CdaR family protein [Bacillota bacterium]